MSRNGTSRVLVMPEGPDYRVSFHPVRGTTVHQRIDGRWARVAWFLTINDAQHYLEAITRDPGAVRLAIDGVLGR